MTTILCVDDEPAIRDVIFAVLTREGYAVEKVPNGFAALESVAQREPDLIILDVQMPRLSGYDVCRELKGNPFTARIPVLMLTAQSAVEDKISGFDAGADDYLGKPFDVRELSARVSALLRLVRRESDRNPSSGLPGGRAIKEEIERRATAARESNEVFSVIYFDLDNFKPFADHFGFAAADAVIAATGVVLSDAVRATSGGDFAGHIGGDDFLIVTTPEMAEPIAHDVRNRFGRAVAHIVAELGDTEAAESGTFVAAGRDGDLRTFPLADITAVILQVTPERWKTVAHLGAFAAAQKRSAKSAARNGNSLATSQPGGAVVVEAL
ncbi:MAG TPA: response regulator [Abditibacteriaceae bacterium]|jgi:diguanylate cyclase (GGDEF)-like protein